MNITLPDDALDLEPREFKVLSALSLMGGRAESIETLAAKSKLTRQTAGKAITWLSLTGKISLIRARGPRGGRNNQQVFMNSDEAAK